jgi:hypothetical protein
MRIKQCNMCPDHMKTFSHFLSKYELSRYKDKHRPALFYGMYQDDVDVLKKHKSLAVIIWRGSDILKKKRLKLAIKKKAKHIAISSFIANDLKRAGVEYKLIPVIGADLSSFKPVPMGDEIYAYALKNRYDFYGGEVLSQLKKKSKFKINIIKRSDKYNKEQLAEMYSRCFCGLRLTPHDGVANTVIELGLMGRRCIYNGQTPNSISTDKTVDNIMNIIEKESVRIGTTDYDTAKNVLDFITIGEEWLHEEYWK